MSVLSNNVIAGASIADDAAGGDAYQIEKSLRFNDDDSAYLKRTFGSGNERKFTWAGWLKRGSMGSVGFFSHATSDTSNPRSDWQLYNDNLYIGFNPTGSSWLEIQTNRFFRDSSAWFHLVVAVDTSQAVNTDRIKIYINGIRETAFQAYSTFTQHIETTMNSATNHNIGRYEAGDNNYFDGSLADVHFIDGLQLSPAAFGSFDSTDNWNPKAFALPAPNNGTTWSSSLTASGGTFDATRAFDGDDATASDLDDNQTAAFKPSEEIVASASIEVLVNNIGSGSFKQNGQEVGGEINSTNGNNTKAWFLLPQLTINTTDGIEWMRGSSWAECSYVYAFRVDGVELIDGQTDVSTRNNVNDGRTWDSTVAAGFNGNPSDNYVTTSTDTITVNFSPEISYNELRFASASGSGGSTADMQYSINGGTLTNFIGGSKEKTVYASGSNTLTSLAIKNTTATNCRWNYLKVDGHHLINGAVDNSFHLKFNDTTSNAALGYDSFLDSVNQPVQAGAILKVKTNNTDFDLDSGVNSDPDKSHLELAIAGNTIADHSHTVKGSGSAVVLTSNGSIATSSDQSKFYGTSIYFDGSNDYIDTAALDTDNKFCMEFWMRPTLIDTCRPFNGADTVDSGTAYLYAELMADGGLKCRQADLGILETSAGEIKVDKWYHIAYTYDGTTERLFIDGVLKDSDTSGSWTPPADMEFRLGSDIGNAASGKYKGYIQDARIYFGTAKYTSAFTPLSRNDFTVTNLTEGPSLSSKGTLRTDALNSNLKLSIPFDDVIANEKSSSSRSLTWTNVTETTDEYKLYNASYDGVNDITSHVTVPASSDWDFGTNDLCVEFWLYITAHVGNKFILDQPETGGRGMCFYRNADGFNYLSDNTNGGSGFLIADKDYMPLNQWNHYAFSKDNGVWNGYVNGVLRSTTSHNYDVGENNTLYIGNYASNPGGNYRPFGYLQDLRIYNHKKYTKPTNVGDTAFTVPGTSVGSATGGLPIWNTPTDNEIDSLVDTPTNYGDEDTGAGGEVRGNYATLNPLKKSNSTLREGNLLGGNTANTDGSAYSTMRCPSTGVWYCEATLKEWTAAGNNFGIGFDANEDSTIRGWNASTGDRGWLFGMNQTTVYKLHANAESNIGSRTTVAGDVVQMCYDADNGKLYCGINNSWIANSSSGASFDAANHTWTDATDLKLGGHFFLNTFDADAYINFGQRPWKYTPPLSAKALCTQNLPDTFSGAELNNPSKYFDILKYTGDGETTQNVKGLSFQPDLVWQKIYNIAGDHGLTDVVRGTAGGYLQSEDTDAQKGNDNDGVSAFLSDGFTAKGGFNSNNNKWITWCWDAGTAASGANDDGSIDIASGNQWKNATAGFSITKWTATNANATIGHGLGAPPELIILKNLDSSTDWGIYHKSIGNTGRLKFTPDATSTHVTFWQNTSPTNTVFSVGTSGDFNGTTDDIIAYCWTPIAGYSSFGAYTGNNNADGPFVYTGFRVKYLLQKRRDDGSNWNLMDIVRDDHYNPLTRRLKAEGNGAEFDGVSTDTQFDACSNGFKVRDTDSGINADGGEYIYAAFAEHPFKTARAK